MIYIGTGTQHSSHSTHNPPTHLQDWEKPREPNRRTFSHKRISQPSHQHTVSIIPYDCWSHKLIQTCNKSKQQRTGTGWTPAQTHPTPHGSCHIQIQKSRTHTCRECYIGVVCHGESFALTLERKLRQRVKRNIPHWEIYEPFFPGCATLVTRHSLKQQGREGFLGSDLGSLCLFFSIRFLCCQSEMRVGDVVGGKAPVVSKSILIVMGVVKGGGDCWSFFVAHNRLPPSQPP